MIVRRPARQPRHDGQWLLAVAVALIGLAGISAVMAGGLQGFGL